jgi:phosphoglycolate phosphatase
MREIYNVLFDLDGTLVDSSAAIRASLAHALEQEGAGWPEGLPVQSLIGMPLVDMFREHFALDGESTERAIAHYRAHYDIEARAATRVYDHVETTLQALCDSGRCLYLATVKPTAVAEKVLLEMGLAGYFRGVAGSSLDHSRREKGDIIRHALQRFGLGAPHSVMVGDRDKDIHGARSNAVYAVAVTYGFGSLEELQSAGPDYVVNCCSELPALLPSVRN